MRMRPGLGDCVSALAMPPLLTRDEAARLLRVSESTVVRLGRTGAIREVRVGKRAIRIDPASVAAHIRASRRQAAA